MLPVLPVEWLEFREWLPERLESVAYTVKLLELERVLLSFLIAKEMGP